MAATPWGASAVDAPRSKSVSMGPGETVLTVIPRGIEFAGRYSGELLQGSLARHIYRLAWAGQDGVHGAPAFVDQLAKPSGRYLRAAR